MNQQPHPKDKIQIGTIGKAHGLGGAFFVSGRNDPWPSSVERLWIAGPKRAPEAFTVQSSRQQGERSVLQLKEITSRDGVDARKGFSLLCLVDDLDYDPAEEFFWADLIGRQVVDCDGCQLGVSTQVANFGASDILYLEDKSGRTLGIPLVSQYFDMDFGRAAEALALVVTAEIFVEAWEDAGAKT